MGFMEWGDKISGSKKPAINNILLGGINIDIWVTRYIYPFNPTFICGKENIIYDKVFSVKGEGEKRKGGG